MIKIKSMLKIAAGLILAGAAVIVAIRQAGQQEGVTVPEWCAAIERIPDPQAQESFFVAVRQGATVPKAAGDFVLGDCADGVCTVAAQGVPCEYKYAYQCGPAVDLGAPGSWRICEVKAHPYFARGWKESAGADFKWFSGWAEMIPVCQAVTSGANCMKLVGAEEKCWLLNTGDICRYGKLLRVAAPGDNPALDCPYAQVVGGFPCEINRGAGSEWTEAAKIWTDESMSELP